MYLIYSYQYNRELLSKGLYRGHSEELLGHYRRECLLVSRRSGRSNMSESLWKRGRVFIPLIQAKQIAEWTRGHCWRCVFFNRHLVGVTDSSHRFAQRFHLSLPFESVSNGSCKHDSAYVSRHSPGSAQPCSSNHISSFPPIDALP